MKKKCNIYLLDTKQTSTIFLYKNKLELTKAFTQHGQSNLTKMNLSNFIPAKHLYFTSDEEIKKGDWVLNPIYNSVYQWIENADIKFDKVNAKKVIATTNPELWVIKNTLSIVQRKGLTNHYPTEKPSGIGKIGFDFVEAYIKAYNEGKPITEVNLEYELINGKLKGTPIREQDAIYAPKLSSNGTVIISLIVNKLYTLDELSDLVMMEYESYLNYLIDNNKVTDKKALISIHLQIGIKIKNKFYVSLCTTCNLPSMPVCGIQRSSKLRIILKQQLSVEQH